MVRANAICQEHQRDDLLSGGPQRYCCCFEHVCWLQHTRYRAHANRNSLQCGSLCLKPVSQTVKSGTTPRGGECESTHPGEGSPLPGLALWFPQSVIKGGSLEVVRTASKPDDGFFTEQGNNLWLYKEHGQCGDSGPGHACAQMTSGQPW